MLCAPAGTLTYPVTVANLKLLRSLLPSTNTSTVPASGDACTTRTNALLSTWAADAEDEKATKQATSAKVRKYTKATVAFLDMLSSFPDYKMSAFSFSPVPL